VAAGLLAAVVVLHLRDPHQSGSYGFCPLLLLTGAYCPGCGGLRAVHDLSNGDVVAAASSNLLLVALVPVAALLWGRWARARWSGSPVVSLLLTRHALWSLAVVVVAFTVLRNLGNLETTAWLAP
jgi:hypothetical protein